MKCYIEELHSKRLFKLDDILSLTGNINTAKDLLLNYRKQKSVANFNNCLYTPEILFDNLDIIERIKDHPMAVWKTRVISDIPVTRKVSIENLQDQKKK